MRQQERCEQVAEDRTEADGIIYRSYTLLMVPSDPHSRLTLEIALIGHGMGDPWPLHFNRPVGQWRFLDGEAKDNWSSFVSVGFSTMNDLNGIHPSLTFGS